MNRKKVDEKKRGKSRYANKNRRASISRIATRAAKKNEEPKSLQGTP